MPNLFASFDAVSIVRNDAHPDSLLGGGLNASPADSRLSQINPTKTSVFYSGDSQDTRRLGHIHISDSLDDYIDDYAVLHESAITALRTR